MSDIPSFTLSTGAKIPAIGLGTWKSGPGEVANAVKTALQAGYRHLDCAYAYGNEAEVGQGIKEAGIPREEIFITSKLWCTFHTNVEAGIDASLKELGLDYVDLYLIHWPIPLNPKGNDPKFPTLPDGSRDIDWSADYAETWAQMEAVQKSGKARAIGVSNMSVPKLEKLLKTAKIPPAANQIELHPLCPQQETVDFCQKNNILVQAYSPLGSTESPILKDEHLTKIAEKLNVSVSNVLISYQVQRGVCVLPKSVTPSRIEQNLKVVKLSDEDFNFISQMHGGKTHRFVKPNWEPFKMEFPDWN